MQQEIRIEIYYLIKLEKDAQLKYLAMAHVIQVSKEDLQRG